MRLVPMEENCLAIEMQEAYFPDFGTLDQVLEYFLSDIDELQIIRRDMNNGTKFP